MSELDSKKIFMGFAKEGVTTSDRAIVKIDAKEDGI